MCRHLSASAERSTSSSDRRRNSLRGSQLPATATVYRDANRQRPARLNHSNGRQFPLPAAKISNINAPLRQKQQQELRVNTGEKLFGPHRLAQQNQSECSHSGESRCILLIRRKVLTSVLGELTVARDGKFHLLSR